MYKWGRNCGSWFSWRIGILSKCHPLSRQQIGYRRREKPKGSLSIRATTQHHRLESKQEQSQTLEHILQLHAWTFSSFGSLTL